jgi:glycosyltransferase involved in cell wall biosynthesis
VPLFNKLGQSLDGQLAVVLSRETHRKRRRWSVPWQDVSFQAELLRTVGIAHGERVFDVSFGVRRTLDRLSPEVVVLDGWDLSASWSSLRWCHRRAVPAVAWVESGVTTGSFRDPLSSLARRRFLDGCGAALVSGDGAAAFVNQLRPGLPTTVVRNAISLTALHALPAPTAESALFVGELSQRKGVDVLLEALPGLLQHLERVVIVGDGQLRPAVADAARRLERVHYLGYLEGPRLVDAFASAGVVVAPSRKDPAPLVASEALAAGRPLVLGPGGGKCQRSASPLARGSERDGDSVRLRADRKHVQGARARGHPGRPYRLHPEFLCRGVPEGHRDRVARRDVDPADHLRTT